MLETVFCVSSIYTHCKSISVGADCSLGRNKSQQFSASTVFAQAWRCAYVSDRNSNDNRAFPVWFDYQVPKGSNRSATGTWKSPVLIFTLTPILSMH